MEVSSVQIYFVAHAQQVPANLLPLVHHQAMKVAVQFTIDAFDINIHTQMLPYSYVIRSKKEMEREKNALLTVF